MLLKSRTFLLNNIYIALEEYWKIKTIASSVKLVSLISLMTACGSCPPNEYIGEVNLSTLSKSFMPYTENDTILVFENSTGTKITLKSEKGREIKHNRIVVDKPCAIEFSDETNIFMDVESEEAFFINDSLRIVSSVFFYSICDVENEQIDSNWVEATFCTVGSYIDEIEDKAFIIITNDREKEIKEEYLNNYKFTNSLLLRNITYNNVYSDSLGKDLFFNKEIGVFAFRYNNELYVLKE